MKTKSAAHAQSNVIALRRNLPKPELSRRTQLLDQFGIKKPLEFDDAKSVLTIDPGVGATQVDTYATVPKGARHDGLFVKLTQTDWTTARIEGPGVEAQMTVPPRTMAGAFGYWAARNGAMTLAGNEYKNSELDRDTGEVVLSNISTDKQGRKILEQRRLRPSAGTAMSGDMLTAMPPKVGLVDFPADYKPEPALLAAQTKAADLKAGATLHVTGKSNENLKAQVTSFVRPGLGGWSDPAGANVDIDTWLRVMNTDRAPIHHDSVVLRSGDSKGRRYNDDSNGPTTIHTTELPAAKLNVGPGESQEIRVEKQTGRAHVEYRLDDSLATRPAGAGEEESDLGASRFMVLDSSKGKRHAGELAFYDGVNQLGSATMEAATPGAASTTSDGRTSGVTATGTTTWSDVRAGGDDTHRAQTVTKDYEFSNISAVAGRLQMTISLEDFSKIDKLLINGKELKTKLEEREFTARLQSERWGGSKVQLTMNMGPGTEEAPKTLKLKLEVQGKFEISQ